jgi:hypothetical protein
MLPAIKALITVNSIEEGLYELCKYGKPRLSCMGKDEWYCNIEMWVQSKGVEFKIASEFKHSSPVEAVSVCIQRLKQALNDLGV